ncbi:MAG TPA: hypothetical protein VHE61_09685 [Opitutaceae bacterium]|nr:hypothetical protein [Opitutaceae bacterium]
MPKETSVELDAVVAVIARFSNGATLDDIRDALPDHPAERTLRRWLTTLVETRRITQSGSARNTRYHVGAPAAIGLAPAAAGPSSPAHPTVNKGTTPRSPDSPPAAAASPSPGELLEFSIPQIVVGVMPPVSVTAFLQTQAMLYLPTLDERTRFVAYGRSVLDRLTADDAAARFGITPEQYHLWRRHFPVAGTTTPPLQDLAPPPAAHIAAPKQPTSVPPKPNALPHA